MGFKSWLLNRSDYTEIKRPNRFDPFLGDRDLLGAFRALTIGDWDRLGNFMERSSKAWIFSQAITGDVVALERITLQRWADVSGNPYARTMLAGVLLREAMEELDSAHSAGLSPENKSRVHDPVREAEQILDDVIQERPAMADPWVFKLISGRILGVDLEEFRQRFDNAHSRQPFRPDACHEYLQGLTKKWGGVQTAVFDFARWVEIEAPSNSPARECLPIAHIEQGLIDGSGENLNQYLARPDVVSEISKAALNFLAATPAPAPTQILGVLNTYAFTSNATDNSSAKLVAELFSRIADRPTAYPWSIYNEGIPMVYREIKDEKMRVAARRVKR